jgi:hypothetical protein
LDTIIGLRPSFTFGEDCIQIPLGLLALL